MKFEKHPYKTNGYLLVFKNGHRWSCVELDYSHQGIYRYEAMMFSTDDSIPSNSPQLRASSFFELFKEVERWEEQSV